MKDRFIIASAGPLAKELAMLAANNATPEAATTGGTENTRAVLRLATLREALADNRQHLIAQAALNNGTSQEEAEKGIAALLSILNEGQTFGLRLTTEQQQIQLRAELRLAQP